MSESNVIWVETEHNFDWLMKQPSHKVIDFTAPAWCVPCQRFAPHFERASEAFDVNAVTFLAVDIDKNPWAMDRFAVQSVPTIMFFDGDTGETSDLSDPSIRNAPKFIAEINRLTGAT